MCVRVVTKDLDRPVLVSVLDKVMPVIVYGEKL